MAVARGRRQLDRADSSAVKVFGTERTVEVYRGCSASSAPAGYLTPGSPGAAPPRRPRARRPPGPDQHLRRRRQRGPARDPGHGRTGHEAGRSVSDRLEDTDPVPRSQRRACSAFVGQSSGPAAAGARTPVNAADDPALGRGHGRPQPVYVDDEAARAARVSTGSSPRPPCSRPGSCAACGPPRLADEARAGGSRPGRRGPRPMMHLLDHEGFTSVVATNCDQHYVRPLVPGDRLRCARSSRPSLSPKRTGLGHGPLLHHPPRVHRVPDADVPEDPSPEEIVALAERGEPVATMRFRILKFLPRPVGRRPVRSTAAPERPPRPRPALTQDNRFFFEGARDHQLLIQRCTSCGDVAPPAPAGVRHLPLLRVGHRDGHGSRHHLQLRGNALPPGAGVRLPAGHRAGRAGGRAPGWWPTSTASPPDVAIGMPVEATFVDFDDELSLPVFRPAPHHLRLPPAPTTIWRDDLMDFTFNDEQHAVSEAADGPARRPGRCPNGSWRWSRPTTWSTASCGPRSAGRPARPGRPRGARGWRATD